MGNSIQDYLKKINRKLTFIDILSLFLTLIAMVALIFIILYKESKQRSEVVYKERGEGTLLQSDAEKNMQTDASRPFASKNGKTYTFSWCKRSNVIASKNKIYFASEEGAKNSGRVLSKLCQK